MRHAGDCHRQHADHLSHVCLLLLMRKGSLAGSISQISRFVRPVARFPVSRRHPLRLNGSQFSGIGAEVVLHVPFKIAVIWRWI